MITHSIAFSYPYIVWGCQDKCKIISPLKIQGGVQNVAGDMTYFIWFLYLHTLYINVFPGFVILFLSVNM